MMPPQPEPPTADDIRAALDRILASRRLRDGPRLTSFLRFVVETTLGGRSDRIKGYTIGVEAFGRAGNFDPQTDPIVRVEATRLRRALTDYYAGEGADDPLLIELPRGRYVPEFRRQRQAHPTGPRWRRTVQRLQHILHMRVTLQAPERS